VGADSNNPLVAYGLLGIILVATIWLIVIKQVLVPKGRLEDKDAEIERLVTDRDRARQDADRAMTFLADEVLPTLGRSNETAGRLAVLMGEVVEEMRAWRQAQRNQ
jgi:hypothetical protein